jgi:hypothetical protein
LFPLNVAKRIGPNQYVALRKKVATIICLNERATVVRLVPLLVSISINLNQIIFLFQSVPTITRLHNAINSKVSISSIPDLVTCRISLNQRVTIGTKDCHYKTIIVCLNYTTRY